MRKHTLAAMAALALLTVGGLAQAPQEKGGGDETGPYDVVVGWPQNYCGPGYVIGSTAGIWAETPDRVIIFSRGCLPEQKDDRGAAESFIPARNASGYDLSQKDPARHPRWDHIVNIVDRNGKLIESWEQHNKLFVRPHRVLVNPYDPERHIWLVDDGAHAIYKFTRDGKKLVMTVGTPMQSGNDPTHFARPTDIAWLPDGTFFVSDGYVNTRVVKFDPNGKFLLTWGQAGTPPNEKRPNYMNTVHAIAIDKNRRVYVADRANSRMQIFDESGKFLEIWPNVRRPYSIMLTEDQHLWIADGTTQKFTKFDLTGKLLYSWGTFAAFPGGFWGVHQFHTDSEGNLYTADVHVGRPQKFRPKKGANPANLVGRYMRGTATATN
ncbi:MAG: peptidyl-alpha-hydroxyglycine alpha-amidating lyase family protein [Vicinamibacterales bacterium]